MEDHPLISIKQASALTSLSRGAINIMRRQGMFPPAVQLGEKRIAFVRSEVDQWIRERIAARTQEAA
ncbi:AlpA family phage regulatory protein [Mesorhizobium sp. WSM3879]|uniref:helix-turn-helix transcriptional regulator n=1 Tax=unclassified Mesorhizobium TaxID=325217 RepID=UPI0007FBC455|nr:MULTISPECIES: AlpA family phage regulatory protein [unclassified Mesorhizobium]OBQ96806.1 transcriptional regulator [Mesorhizobium sp. AA23]PBB81295.1 AlpA family phage regulatory protein [Mesorhizobium sp. WSM3879]